MDAQWGAARRRPAPPGAAAPTQAAEAPSRLPAILTLVEAQRQAQLWPEQGCWRELGVDVRAG
jgi:hypothetical protein